MPAVSLCLAGNAGGNVLSSTDANAVAPSWREVSTGPSVPITGISCPTATRCAVVGMAHFVPSKSHSSSSNCTCVSGATLIAFTEMLSGGQQAIDRMLGQGASCKAKFSALLRSEMGAADRSLQILADGTSKAARAKLAAKLQTTSASASPSPPA